MKRFLRPCAIAAIAGAIVAVPAASASLGSAAVPLRGTSAQYTLSVAEAGPGLGSVTSSPAGIDPGTNCWYGCSAVFPAGTQVTLTVTPASGFVVDYTRGCIGPHAACKVTMSGDRRVTVYFGPYVPPPPPSLCIVPNVKGKTLAIAKNMIHSRNCKLGTIRHAASLTVGKGHVISQKPKPGTYLRRGAKVNLVVSRGRR